MDDSQSSDFFSNSGDQRYNFSKVDIVDDTSYESLLANTKASLAKNFNNVKDTSKVSSLLEDCGSCITQSLDLVLQILVESNTDITKLQECLEHAVTILQMLSNYVKEVVESVALSCQTVKAFPTATGKIIMNVFTHCKDSELLYGSKLKMAEKQLKDLFRSCHALQLTYLMVLEKHFVFDFMDGEQVNVLLEALDINLRIGELVQSLDVKTMAEQWKGFTMICEKYSNCLKDGPVFDKCNKVLCSMIENNVNIGILDAGPEDKVSLRSLKVANFALKILTKICTIFKLSANKNFADIVDLLIGIYLTNNTCDLTDLRGQLKNAARINIILPTESLLNELLVESQFIHNFTNIDVKMLKRDDKMLGYLLLLISVIKLAALKEGCSYKRELIECVYKVLPHGYTWFNIGLSFRIENKDPKYWGLYESLISSYLSLALTLEPKEFIVLEQKMYEAILSSDCFSALFSCNLWTLLARYTTQEYNMSQVTHLCKTCQRLETNKLFSKSPQRIHLSFLLRALFKMLPDSDKFKILKEFDIKKEDNFELWSVLQIRNCPASDISAYFVEKLTLMLNEEISTTEDLFALIKTMQVTSTCPKITDGNLEEAIVNAWMRLCPNYNNFVCKNLNRETVWIYDYVEALIALTENLNFMLDTTLAKTTHIVTELVLTCSLEVKLLLVMFTSKLTCLTNNGPNKLLVQTKLATIFKSLMKEEILVRDTFLNYLHQGTPNSNMETVLIIVFKEDSSLETQWKYYERRMDAEWSENDLEMSSTYKYSHKCLENEIEELSGSPVSVVKTCSNNFEFADIDSLFEGDSDQEPACKKVKLDTELEEILSRVENDVVQLCNVKENFTESHRNKIRDICEKLNNIVK